jgi:hypothetical protein
MAGSPGYPVFRLSLAGSAHSLSENRVVLHDLVPWSVDGATSVAFSITGGPLGTLPDAYAGKSFALYQDEGSGEALIFAGDVTQGPGISYDPDIGWIRSYQATGLYDRGNLLPVTNPEDATDTVSFNESRESGTYRADRAGRTVGEMLFYVLDAPENATPLDGLGIGGYGTIPTTRATAHATVSSGAVTVVVDDGGAGYDSGDAPTVLLIGGEGTYTSATPTITGGAVASVSVSGSSGYVTAPNVVITALPANTVTDLLSLDLIPPYPVTVAGERLLQAIQGVIKSNQPNHFVHVEPAGVMRVHDARDASAVTLTMDSATQVPAVDVAGINMSRSVDGCYSRVVVRGGPKVDAVLLGLDEGTLEEHFDHDGLTSEADIKALWRPTHFTNPASTGLAKFTAGISAGAVNALTNGFKGFGYTASTTYNLAFTGGGGSGAAATMTTDSSGQYTSHSITNGGSGYTTAPTVIAPPPANTALDSGTCSCTSTTEVEITSADTRRTWAANYWDQTAAGRQGTIFLSDSTVSGVDIGTSAGVVANDAITAGGSATVTLDRTLPATTFDTYVLVGTAGEGALVWRNHRPVDTDVRASLASYFPFPVAYAGTKGASATLTSFPIGLITKGESVSTCPVRVDVDSGAFIFDQPVVNFYGADIADDEAAATENVPDNVQVLAAVVKGSLEAIKPADSKGAAQYSGTLATVEGIERTLYVGAPSWIDAGQQANMERYSQEVLDSVSNTVVEGTIPLLGWDSQFMSPGKAITLAGDGYDTPWDSEEIPVVSARYAIRAGQAPRYVTTLQVSNRRAAYSASMFERPLPTGLMIGGDIAAGGLDGADLSPQWAGFAGVIGERPTSNVGYLGAAIPNAGRFLNAAMSLASNYVNTATTAASNYVGGAVGASHAYVAGAQAMTAQYQASAFSGQRWAPRQMHGNRYANLATDAALQANVFGPKGMPGEAGRKTDSPFAGE